MSLVDESKDPSTDARSEESDKHAEEALKDFDRVMANAVRRYKAERGWNNPTLADKISTQEHMLAKGCCLLCEQTGYGAEENDVGETLMEETRGIMSAWKNEVWLAFLVVSLC
jgi:ribosome-binding protein aMBF1 (putative translation factor)